MEKIKKVKICKECGISNEEVEFAKNRYMCVSCYRNYKKAYVQDYNVRKLAEQKARIKKKSKHDNRLDLIAIECAERGISYGRWQQEETTRLIREREGRDSNGRKENVF